MKNKAEWLQVEQFLLHETQIKKLSENTRSLIRQGKVNPRDAGLAVRASIVAGGTVNLLDGYNSRIKGRNDFDGNKLTSGRNFVITGLTLNYGETVSADNVNVESVNYNLPLPAALKTANFAIIQNDQVIRRIPIAHINIAKSTDGYWFNLKGYALLLDEVVTKLDIEFAQNTDLGAVAANTSHVEVLFDGFETNIKR